MDDDELNKNTTDMIVPISRATLNLIPWAGPIIAEIVTEIIPNQRIERIVDYIKQLKERISSIEEDVLRQRMTNPEFIALFEDGAIQSAKALTSERREKIAAILANSLSEERLDFLQAKVLLNLLGELNEAELIILK